MAFFVMLSLVFFLGVPLIAGAFLYLRFKPLFEAAGAENRHPEVKGSE